MKPASLALLFAACLAVPAVFAAGAHEHGVVHLDVAVEGRAKAQFKATLQPPQRRIALVR